VDILVELEGESPFWVVFYIFYDEGGDRSGFTPFGLKEEQAVRSGPGGPLFGPVEIGFIEDDHF
jgi:hypothetical protein